MTIKKYEDNIKQEISNIIEEIISNNPTLSISVKSRGGAEISDWIEEQFVHYTKDSKVLLNSEQAPKEKTKNPWDAKTFYLFNGHKEEIWIDFKAFKIDKADSNPDIGTPDKLIKHINNGNFYLLFIHLFYKETSIGLKFAKMQNNYVKSYFLKDVSSTVRRNTKNQLQVNISAEPEYRTRDEFIAFFIKKLKEGYDRQIKLANDRKDKINIIENELIISNKHSLKAIEEILQ